jgi:hypothetical protein
MKVFITASGQWTGLFWKEYLQRHGHMVTSTWHDQPMCRSSTLDASFKVNETEKSFQQIRNSDFLLVIADPDMVPGGKFVDVGYALGSGKKVILVGRRENFKMWGYDVVSVDTANQVLTQLLEDENSPVPQSAD